MSLRFTERWQYAVAVCLLGTCIHALAETGPVPKDDQDTARTVDVYWQRSRSIAAPGITSVIVLDPEICGVQTSTDNITITNHHHHHHAAMHHAAMAAHPAMAATASAAPAAISSGSGPTGTSGGRISVSGLVMADMS